MVESETGQPIGQEELQDMRSNHANSRDVSKLAKTILRLTIGSNAQGQCSDNGIDYSNEMWWIWLAMFVLAVAWVGFAVAAYKLWLRLDRRMQHNELQQAETDTFTGHQRDLVDEQRTNLRNLETRYNSYVRQTDQELATIEEYVDCVRDGLVHYGGFMRFNELSRQQRSEMFTQERANQILFRARQVAPDTTDTVVDPGVHATHAPGTVVNPGVHATHAPGTVVNPGVHATHALGSNAAGSAAAEPLAVHDYVMEEDEEEEPAENDVLADVNPASREGELVRIVRHLRAQVNEALAYQHVEDARDIQQTLETVLDSAQSSPHLTWSLQEGSQGHTTGCIDVRGTEVTMLWPQPITSLPRTCIDFCSGGQSSRHASLEGPKIHLAMKYGLVGDSSLYTKRKNTKNKKKSYISTVLREKFGFANLTQHIFPGGDVQELHSYLKTGPEFDTLGVSYFGNKHTKMPMDVEIEGPYWQDVFRLLGEKVAHRVVFFVGGYAAKYNYGRVYDENLKIIKQWIKDAGFKVVEARQEVSQWELAGDELHFSVESLSELAAFWSQLLMPPKFIRPGKRLTEQSEPDSSSRIPPVKKARKDSTSEGARDEQLLDGCAEAEDKKKLNDELARHRMMLARQDWAANCGPSQDRGWRSWDKNFWD
eukprot:s705_g6.t1